jgi:hypothetical protein
MFFLYCIKPQEYPFSSNLRYGGLHQPVDDPRATARKQNQRLNNSAQTKSKRNGIVPKWNRRKEA